MVVLRLGLNQTWLYIDLVLTEHLRFVIHPGKLWGNINALAVGSLANYAAMLADADPALSADMSALAEKIRSGWLKTVHRGVDEHNFFYENFEPEKGEPRGAGSVLQNICQEHKLGVCGALACV